MRAFAAAKAFFAALADLLHLRRMMDSIGAVARRPWWDRPRGGHKGNVTRARRRRVPWTPLELDIGPGERHLAVGGRHYKIDERGVYRRCRGGQGSAPTAVSNVFHHLERGTAPGDERRPAADWSPRVPDGRPPARHVAGPRRRPPAPATMDSMTPEREAQLRRLRETCRALAGHSAWIVFYDRDPRVWLEMGWLIPTMVDDILHDRARFVADLGVFDPLAEGWGQDENPGLAFRLIINDAMLEDLVPLYHAACN